MIRPNMRMLVGSMLAQLQDDRPTIQEIVEYPFMKEMPVLWRAPPRAARVPRT